MMAGNDLGVTWLNKVAMSAVRLYFDPVTRILRVVRRTRRGYAPLPDSPGWRPVHMPATTYVVGQHGAGKAAITKTLPQSVEEMMRADIVSALHGDAFEALFRPIVNSLPLSDDPTRPFSPDSIQEALFAAWQNLPEYDGDAGPGLTAWFMTILWNKQRDEWRKQKTIRKYTPTSTDVYDDALGPDLDGDATPAAFPLGLLANEMSELLPVHLMLALQELEADEANIVIEKYFDGKANSDLAKELNKTPAAIANADLRARKKLARALVRSCDKLRAELIGILRPRRRKLLELDLEGRTTREIVSILFSSRAESQLTPKRRDRVTRAVVAALASTWALLPEAYRRFLEP